MGFIRQAGRRMMMIGKRSAFGHGSASISDSTNVDHLGRISALRFNKLYSTATFIRAWHREIPLRPHRCRLGGGGERQLLQISAAAMPQRQGLLPALRVAASVLTVFCSRQWPIVPQDAYSSPLHLEAVLFDLSKVCCAIRMWFDCRSLCPISPSNPIRSKALAILHRFRDL